MEFINETTHKIIWTKGEKDGKPCWNITIDGVDASVGVWDLSGRVIFKKPTKSMWQEAVLVELFELDGTPLEYYWELHKNEYEKLIVHNNVPSLRYADVSTVSIQPVIEWESDRLWRDPSKHAHDTNGKFVLYEVVD